MKPAAPLDLDQLRAAFTKNTRAIVINTPNNPTGRVFTHRELTAISELCQTFDVIAVTDEIYEHILYDGVHIPLATLDGMRDRTITISGASKTFSVTGWRIGTMIAPPDITSAIRKVHDFLTVGAPAPLQEGIATALEELPDSYYEGLAGEYRERRDVLYQGLCDAGFKCAPPDGAYYIMADFSDLSSADDVTYAKSLASNGGVATVPGSSFYHDPELGRKLIRFAFCKRLETLRAAADRLRGIARKTA
jgi:aminotransferase